MERGVLYIATKSEYWNQRGDYLKMAFNSIDSLRKVSNLPITVITNVPCNREDINIIQVKSLITERDYTKDKVFYRELTPYAATLYIDADTEILEDPEPLFNTSYDLCMPHAPVCDYANKIWYGMRGGFKYCTAMYLWNKNQITDLVFERAKTAYLEMEKDSNRKIHNPDVKNYISDQYVTQTVIQDCVGILGLNVKTLHPRWIGIPPIYKYVNNPAVIHSRYYESDRREEFSKWTIDNDTLLDDLSLWS